MSPVDDLSSGEGVDLVAGTIVRLETDQIKGAGVLGVLRDLVIMSLCTLDQMMLTMLSTVKGFPVNDLSGTVALGDSMFVWEEVHLPGRFHCKCLHDLDRECLIG